MCRTLGRKQSSTPKLRAAWVIVFAMIAFASFVLALISLVNAIKVLAVSSWDENLSPFVGLFSLSVASVTAVLALWIEYKQAVQSVQSDEAKFGILERIDRLSLAAAREAEAAHGNTESILHRLEQAEEAKQGKVLSADQRGRVVDVYSRKSLSGGRVLWVDDVPSSITYEREAFELAGVSTVWIGDTEGALGLLEGNKFDVIISDMGRPESERAGYELLESVRRRGDAAPFVIYSSSRSPEHIEEATSRGCLVATNDPVELFEVVMEEILKAY